MALVALVLVRVHVRASDLHVSSQDRVCGSQHGPQEQRGRRSQAEPPPAEEPDRGDADRHRDEQQPPGGRPAQPLARPGEPERAVQGEADTQQRQQHGKLGDLLDHGPVLQRIQHPIAQRQQPDPHPSGEQHDRRGERQPVQRRGQYGGQQDREAADEVERASHWVLSRVGAEGIEPPTTSL